MTEVFGRPDDVAAWQSAVDGVMPDWDVLLAEYAAAIDWPASAFWRELSTAYPDAIVLLSVRDSPAVWWRSADATVLEVLRRPGERAGSEAWTRMAEGLVHTELGEDWDDATRAMAAYERHNAEVRASVPADRLVEWWPGDGWAPLALALDVPVPDEPFPHNNSTAEFREMAGFA